MDAITKRDAMPRARRREALSLTKWYLDCCDASGRSVICYWASLSWRGIELVWNSVALFESGRTVYQRSRIARIPAPAVHEGRIAWHAPVLGCVVEGEIRQSRVGGRLLEREEGAIEWWCEAPVALVAVELNGRSPVCGAGYAERIELTIPPWRLPIRELRWGRWHDDDARRSLVWIDWRGPPARTWTFVDGSEVHGTTVTDRRVENEAFSLALDERQILKSRGAGEIVRSIPALRAAVPASIFALDGTKWSSTGTLRERGAPPLTGKAIHEVVVFG